MCANNLPKVVRWKRRGRESNLRPMSRKSNGSGATDRNRCCPNVVAIIVKFTFRWYTAEIAAVRRFYNNDGWRIAHYRGVLLLRGTSRLPKSA